MADNEKPKLGGRTFAALMKDYGPRLSLQTPADLIWLMVFCMPVYSSFRVCIEAGIFRKLAQASPESLTIGEIASGIPGVAETDAAEREEFLSRILGGVSGLNFIDEVEANVFRANEVTLTMAEPGFEAGFRFCFDSTFGPKSTAMEVFNYAKSNGYKAPTASDDGPFQHARGTVGSTAFEEWGKDNRILDLSVFMQQVQKDRTHWSEWFPADVLLERYQDGGVFMVDVGGSYGHDLSGMASRYLEGKKTRLILQDQAAVIKGAKEQKLDPRIEFVEHNFFEPQPVKGAEIYFMHKIMHDWPDHDSVRILSHLRDAMAPRSRIFINDMILPDQGSPLIMAAYDVMMLSMLAAKERSESGWKRLISQVEGLEIRKLWQAPALRGEGIIEIVRVGA